MTRARAVALSVLLLAAPALAFFAAPAAGSLTARGPIVILSNAHFTAGNGVVGGTGTPADPYVISGWHIVTTIGAAIAIRDVTASFVVRGNLLESSGNGAVAISLADVHGVARIESNQILHWGAGISLTRADADVVGNQLLAKSTSALGVNVKASRATIRLNYLDAGATSILLDSWGPRVESNTITASSVGVRLENAFWMDVVGNRIDRVGTGVVVGQGLANVTGNLFVQGKTSVSATGTAILNVRDNVVDGAQTDAMVFTKATVYVTNNRVISAIGRGIVAVDATGEIRANFVNKTAGGITLSGASVVKVQSNAMVDNEYGVSIPFSARASIPHFSGNTANGVSLNGVYRWRVSNVIVAGGTYEAAWTAGGYGGLTAEGAFVLYEVDNALLTGVTIRGGPRGVTAVNSYNVQVEGSLIVNAKCGVVFDGTVGFIKNTTITIPVDPPATCGVDVKGGFVGLFNNTITNFDVGVRIDAAAKAEVALNVLSRNAVGLHLSGSLTQKTDAVVVYKNQIKLNAKGAVVVGFRGTFLHNNVTANTQVGIEVQLQAYPKLVANNITLNAEGVVDSYACVTLAYQTCSGAHLEANVIARNGGTGVRLNGTAYLQANVIANNSIGADLRGGADLRANVIVDNRLDGARVAIRVDARGDVVLRNGEAGFRFTGMLFLVSRANVSANFHGIVVVEALVTPPTPQPGPPTVFLPSLRIDRDPLFVHLTRFEGNRGDAIRASPWTPVNATHNWWGTPNGPRLNVGDVVGAYQNGVTAGPIVYAPWWTDRAMTTTGPVAGL